MLVFFYPNFYPLELLSPTSSCLLDPSDHNQEQTPPHETEHYLLD